METSPRQAHPGYMPAIARLFGARAECQADRGNPLASSGSFVRRKTAGESRRKSVLQDKYLVKHFRCMRYFFSYSYSGFTCNSQAISYVLAGCITKLQAAKNRM